MYHTPYQLREMPTTLTHRRGSQAECQGRVEVKPKQKRNVYHAFHQPREMSTTMTYRRER